MSITGAMRISVEGMNRQVEGMTRVADNIANATTGHDRNVNIDHELVDMTIAEHNFKANFRVFQISEEVMDQIINLKR